MALMGQAHLSEVGIRPGPINPRSREAMSCRDRGDGGFYDLSEPLPGRF
jgi:hypothetical protein